MSPRDLAGREGPVTVMDLIKWLRSEQVPAGYEIMIRDVRHHYPVDRVHLDVTDQRVILTVDFPTYEEEP